MQQMAAPQEQGRNFFIVSKPIQYITARNLAEQLGGGNNVLLLITKFSGADALHARALQDSIWSDVMQSDNRSALIRRKLARHGGGGNLYSDSDIFMSGITNKLLCPFGAISVYEEGFYSYLPDISSHLQQQGKSIKKALYRLLRLNSAHGGSRFTRQLFLYVPTACRKPLKIARIETPALEYIRRNLDTLCEIFSFDPSSLRLDDSRDPAATITIYCTSHSLENYRKNALTHAIDLVKPHPIFKSTAEFSHPTIPPSVPIEIAVVLLNQRGYRVHLVHEGSTALFYLAPLLKSGDLSQENLGTFASQLDTAYSNLLGEITSQC